MTEGPDYMWFDENSLSPDTSWSNAWLEKALRSAVRDVYREGNLEDLTVKRVRKATERLHNMSEDFFKSHTYWKQKSKDVIQSEVDSLSHEPASSQPISQSRSQGASPEKPQVSKLSQAGNHGKKRSSAGELRPEKRQKKDSSDSLGSDGDGEEPESKRPATKAQERARSSSSSLSSVADEKLIVIDQAVNVSKRESVPNGNVAADSESEMSVVLDEAPKPKPKRRSTGSEHSKSKKTRISKDSGRTQQAVDTKIEEIKRLQGCLVRCGMRKQWYRELAPYDTPEAKIRHLKQMLSDLGMTGRFSIEKATQIREERELKADLEAVQERAKLWGKAESEEDTGRPRRRLAKGLQELDFLNDNDGEETD